MKCRSLFSGSDALNLADGVYLLMLILSAVINDESGCRTQICTVLCITVKPTKVLYLTHICHCQCAKSLQCV